ARAVADGEEDKLFLLLRLLERLRPPGVPVHGVVGVLEQVGADLAGQPVGLALRLLLRLVGAGGEEGSGRQGGGGGEETDGWPGRAGGRRGIHVGWAERWRGPPPLPWRWASPALGPPYGSRVSGSSAAHGTFTLTVACSRQVRSLHAWKVTLT